MTPNTDRSPDYSPRVMRDVPRRVQAQTASLRAVPKTANILTSMPKHFQQPSSELAIIFGAAFAPTKADPKMAAVVSMSPAHPVKKGRTFNPQLNS